MINLWEETVKILKIKGLGWQDVVGVRCKDFIIEKSNYESLAKGTVYDEGFGSSYVAGDLVLIGESFVLVRDVYDDTYKCDWAYEGLSALNEKRGY